VEPVAGPCTCKGLGAVGCPTCAGTGIDKKGGKLTWPMSTSVIFIYTQIDPKTVAGTGPETVALSFKTRSSPSLKRERDVRSRDAGESATERERVYYRTANNFLDDFYICIALDFIEFTLMACET